MDTWEGEVSALYNQYVHQKSSFFAYCSEALVLLLDLKPEVRVLDLAGGAGMLSRMILERQPTAHITILDRSAEQLQHARDIFHDNATYIQQTAEQYVPEEPFDIVVCANAFWYLHTSIIKHIADWLVPGGQLVFNLHERNTQFKDSSFFTQVHDEIDALCKERYHTRCIIYSALLGVEKLNGQLSEAGFIVEQRADTYEEPQENWSILCELQGRKTTPYMALNMDDEIKLGLFRTAFRAVAAREGKITRQTLLFNCRKRV
jgi:trans-aconitate methyltransferase